MPYENDEAKTDKPVDAENPNEEKALGEEVASPSEDVPAEASEEEVEADEKSEEAAE